MRTTRQAAQGTMGPMWAAPRPSQCQGPLRPANSCMAAACLCLSPPLPGPPPRTTQASTHPAPYTPALADCRFGAGTQCPRTCATAKGGGRTVRHGGMKACKGQRPWQEYGAHARGAPSCRCQQTHMRATMSRPGWLRPSTTLTRWAVGHRRRTDAGTSGASSRARAPCAATCTRKCRPQMAVRCCCKAGMLPQL